MNYCNGNTIGNNGTKTAGQEKAERDERRAKLLAIASNNLMGMEEGKARRAIQAIIFYLKVEG